MELDSHRAAAQYNLGLFYAVMGDWSTSRQEYEKAFTISTPERLSAAIKDVQDAMKSQPDSESLQSGLHLLRQHQ
jgi:hypothetical protein